MYVDQWFLLHTQNRSEATLFERLKLNLLGKFGKLISAIIEKSWPRDYQGNHQEGEEAVLNHLLSWTAAKNILQLYGIGKNSLNHAQHSSSNWARVNSFIAEVKYAIIKISVFVF